MAAGNGRRDQGVAAGNWAAVRITNSRLKTTVGGRAGPTPSAGPGDTQKKMAMVQCGLLN